AMFQDSPEYQKRTKSDFKPSNVTIQQVRSVMPKELHQVSTAKGLYYTAQTIAFPVLFYISFRYVNDWPLSYTSQQPNHLIPSIIHFVSLLVYWWWQGIALTGVFCLGHEAGHGNISSHSRINHMVGYFLHTCLLLPYYSWRSTHQAHHKATGSIKKDENFVPRTRAELGLPPWSEITAADYKEILEETPIYVLINLLVTQLLGLQLYMSINAGGSLRYPRGTNHYLPSSPLFKPSERRLIIISDVGIATMCVVLLTYAKCCGWSAFLVDYVVPYLLSNHWIVMLTFLQHSDPTIPYYRGGKWSFMRGALATVDRLTLGWIDRFFFHNASHNHTAHHLFSHIPFYNQPQVTKKLKEVLKDEYNYDSTNCFRVLYRSFTQCYFVEDEGNVVFYKNSRGEAARQLAPED
ncbi:delta-12 fatty acid desaturase protein, partial [Punctularia strigosozonata HHB-11173 SS5]|uniref:delta-12 fatty acid desaturase protein n=1 Tax=Punctularia strigosozonata (strain HHB-11173) TaxID=741275 RepID=UPI0004416431